MHNGMKNAYVLEIEGLKFECIQKENYMRECFSNSVAFFAFNSTTTVFKLYNICSMVLFKSVQSISYSIYIAITFY